MSDTQSIDDIRKEAEALTAAEVKEAQAKGENVSQPSAESKRDPITHDFVIECSRARDKGNGVLYACLMRNRFLFVPEQNQWLEYGGNYWQTVTQHRVDASVERVAEKFTAAMTSEKNLAKDARADDDKDTAKFHEARAKALSTSIWNLHSPGGVNACLKFALGNDAPLLVKAEELDYIPQRLACQNGIVDLRTGEHRPGRPDDYVTRVAAAEWQGMEAPAPIWREIVYQILGEREDVARYFQKIMGYAFSGKLSEKILVILLGEEGDSGKTTLFEILFQILPGYAEPMPVELLLDQGIAQNPNSPTPAIMNLRGQRVTSASEPGEGRRFSVDRVKLLSGKDSLVGRYPWDKGQTKFQPTHTLFLLTNHKMRAGAHDQPFWSRVRLLECPFSFVPEPDPHKPNQRPRRDNLMEDIIATEGAGVLAWIAEGYQLYLAEGLTQPESVREATARYRREEDLLAQFIDDCLEDSPGDTIAGAELYDGFRKWFEGNFGKKTPSISTFGKLATRHIRKEKVNGIMRYFDKDFTAEARAKYLPKS